jgi:chromosome segregation ATPase
MRFLRGKIAKKDAIELGAEKVLEDLEREARPVEEELPKEESETVGELREMSMSELWQRASKLGISKKGNKDQLMEKILEAEKEDQLMERVLEAEKEDQLMERVLEAKKEQGIEAVEDTGVFEILDLLKHDLKEFENAKEGLERRAESTSKLVPKLIEKKELLEKEVLEREREVAEINDLVPKLEEKKVKIEEDIQQKQEEKEFLEKEIKERQKNFAEIADLISKLESIRDTSAHT